MLRRLNVDDLPQTGLQVKVVYLRYYKKFRETIKTEH